jgi:hypothetical protein
MEDPRRRFRRGVLAACGAAGQSVDELLAYNDKPFPPERAAARPSFPLEDEPHVSAWTDYEREAARVGPFEALRNRFVQLEFPIRQGISSDPLYRQATLRGVVEHTDADALPINDPARLELAIVSTVAGRVPVLVAGDRRDFVTLVRAFSERNEPAPIPDAMGACIVKGLNNWDRIRRYRARWEAEQETPGSEEAWAEEFRRLIPRKEEYQDRFIILSRGPYSAIAAKDAGFDDAAWIEHSLVIRREHELTHYFTYRVFGTIRNNVFDELIADFAALVRTFGQYRADMALRFLGLEAYPTFRAGGRLEVYRGKPPVSDSAFATVLTLAVLGARNLEAFAESHQALVQDLGEFGRLIFALTTMTLEELASAEMPGLLDDRLLDRAD